MKLFKGWRTMAFAASQALIGLAAVITPDMLELIVSDDAAARRFGAIQIGYAVVMAGLRYITTSPVGKSL